MDDNADVKRILLASSLADWRRQLGHPCITWLSTIQQDLKQQHLMLPEAADLAQNRPLWRMMSTYGAMQSWVACQKRWRRQVSFEALASSVTLWPRVWQLVWTTIESLGKRFGWNKHNFTYNWISNQRIGLSDFLEAISRLIDCYISYNLDYFNVMFCRFLVAYKRSVIFRLSSRCQRPVTWAILECLPAATRQVRL